MNYDERRLWLPPGLATFDATTLHRRSNGKLINARVPARRNARVVSPLYVCQLSDVERYPVFQKETELMIEPNLEPSGSIIIRSGYGKVSIYDES